MKIIYSLCTLFVLSAAISAENNVRPAITLAPLFVYTDDYGVYWGASISSGVVVKKHHAILATADIAPVGFLGITDVETNGEESHYGATLAYQYKFIFAKEFLSIAPGIIVGFSSIPFVYGTYRLDNVVIDYKAYPEREVIWGVGPDLTIELGRKKPKFFMRNRFLYVGQYNMAMLPTIGISYSF